MDNIKIKKFEISQNKQIKIPQYLSDTIYISESNNQNNQKRLQFLFQSIQNSNQLSSDDFQKFWDKTIKKIRKQNKIGDKSSQSITNFMEKLRLKIQNAVMKLHKKTRQNKNLNNKDKNKNKIIGIEINENNFRHQNYGIHNQYSFIMQSKRYHAKPSQKGTRLFVLANVIFFILYKLQKISDQQIRERFAFNSNPNISQFSKENFLQNFLFSIVHRNLENLLQNMVEFIYIAKQVEAIKGTKQLYLIILFSCFVNSLAIKIQEKYDNYRRRRNNQRIQNNNQYYLGCSGIILALQTYFCLKFPQNLSQYNFISMPIWLLVLAKSLFNFYKSIQEQQNEYKYYQSLGPVVSGILYFLIEKVVSKDNKYQLIQHHFNKIQIN